MILNVFQHRLKKHVVGFKSQNCKRLLKFVEFSSIFMFDFFDFCLPKMNEIWIDSHVITKGEIFLKERYEVFMIKFLRGMVKNKQKLFLVLFKYFQ